MKKSISIIAAAAMAASLTFAGTMNSFADEEAPVATAPAAAEEAETTTTEAAETTTTEATETTTTTTAATTTTTTTTTKATTTTTKTTAKPNSPKTGVEFPALAVTGIGVSAIAIAFALKKKED